MTIHAARDGVRPSLNLEFADRIACIEHCQESFMDPD